MEKIYIENNKNKKRIVNTSVVLSFAVSFFAIISLAMFGIVSNQGTDVSYAAPSDELPDSFNFTIESGKKVWSDTGFAVPIYMADNNKERQVFCVEYAVDPGTVEYNIGDGITDSKLLYLLNNTYVNGVNRVEAADLKDVTDARRYAETWITQTAIWLYLRSEDSTNPNYMSGEKYQEIKNAKELTLNDGTTNPTILSVGDGETIYSKYIEGLLRDASNASDEVNLKIEAKKDIEITQDKKYYQSSLVTVSGDPSTSLKSFDITISGVEGAEAVNEKGEKISLNGMTPGTKFYVRIPANKLTQKVQKVKISAKGAFNSLAGNYYTAATAGLQKVVTVRAIEKSKDAALEIEFVKAPDTGMNTAQTIYFIGLIVLLCGVGIVYANAKPVQVK